MWPPSPFSALPPKILYLKASPKGISRRTSYLQVRLEFLRYPHVIAIFFNRCAFGPPWCLTTTSPCTWIGHLVSGLLHATSRPLQTRFPFGSAAEQLNLAAYNNSPVRSTKSTRSRLTRALSACKHRVSGSLSLPSRGAFHLSLTVLFAIGHHRVFSLGGWSPLLPTGFLVSRGTLDLSSLTLNFVYEALTLSGRSFQTVLLLRPLLSAGPQPQETVVSWFGLFPFRSPLL